MRHIFLLISKEIRGMLKENLGFRNKFLHWVLKDVDISLDSCNPYSVILIEIPPYESPTAQSIVVKLTRHLLASINNPFDMSTQYIFFGELYFYISFSQPLQLKSLSSRFMEVLTIF